MLVPSTWYPVASKGIPAVDEILLVGTGYLATAGRAYFWIASPVGEGGAISAFMRATTVFIA
jgi:hypothetical protein